MALEGGVALSAAESGLLEKAVLAGSWVGAHVLAGAAAVVSGLDDREQRELKKSYGE
jgi:hypothetical protein